MTSEREFTLFDANETVNSINFVQTLDLDCLYKCRYKRTCIKKNSGKKNNFFAYFPFIFLAQGKTQFLSIF